MWYSVFYTFRKIFRIFWDILAVSGLTFSFVFRDCPWLASVNHRGCWELNTGQFCARQSPFLPSIHSSFPRANFSWLARNDSLRRLHGWVIKGQKKKAKWSMHICEERKQHVKSLSWDEWVWHILSQKKASSPKGEWKRMKGEGVVARDFRKSWNKENEWALESRAKHLAAIVSTTVSLEMVLNKAAREWLFSMFSF